jgi:flagellar FliJ protein
MVKHNPLNTLADLAQDDTDKAARELGRLQGLRTQAEQQLNALTQYRQEYRVRMQAIAAEGMSSSRWHDFSRFLDSLDHAIRQQTNALARPRPTCWPDAPTGSSRSAARTRSIR